MRTMFDHGMMKWWGLMNPLMLILTFTVSPENHGK
jgi:hypothetical protein